MFCTVPDYTILENILAREIESSNPGGKLFVRETGLLDFGWPYTMCPLMVKFLSLTEVVLSSLLLAAYFLIAELN